VVPAELFRFGLGRFVPIRLGEILFAEQEISYKRGGDDNRVQDTPDFRIAVPEFRTLRI